MINLFKAFLCVYGLDETLVFWFHLDERFLVHFVIDEETLRCIVLRCLMSWRFSAYLQIEGTIMNYRI